MTNQPESNVNARLNRLESLFADMGDVLLSQSDAITQIGEQTARNTNAIAQINEQTARNTNAIAQLTTSINELANQAALDRQQAVQDRQQAAIDRQAFQAEIQRIWDYLLRQSGNGRNNP